MSRKARAGIKVLFSGNPLCQLGRIMSRHAFDVRFMGFPTHFEWVSPTVMRMHQRLELETPYLDITPYGRLWSFSVAEVAPGQLFAHRQGTRVPLEGRIAFFLPPFSLQHWEVIPSRLDFDTLFCAEPPPAGLPQGAVAFDYAGPVPDSVSQVPEIISQARELIAIAKEERMRPVVARLKTLIDESYTSAVGVGDLAQRLEIAPAQLTRYFAAAYGIPPVVYRNRLRIMDSLRMLLLEKASVTNTAAEMGFADSGHFLRAFKSRLKNVPSQFRF